MTKGALLLVSAALALAGADAPYDLGPTRLMSGSATMQSGVTIQFATYLVPGKSPGLRYGEGGIGGNGGGAVSRQMTDPVTGAYFGYDLAITGDAVSGYRAVFSPLTRTNGRPLAASPKFPAPQPVRDGDTIALEIMSSPDGSHRIVDYIQIFTESREPKAATARGEARDFTIDDGPVTYDSDVITYWIDGQQWTGMTGFTRKPGATFWISVPGRGRYALSLAPETGFRKAGVVRDNVLAFEDGGRKYEIRFMSPVAGGGKVWNLYMLHDASYRPAGPLRISSGIDRLQNLAR